MNYLEDAPLADRTVAGVIRFIREGVIDRVPEALRTALDALSRTYELSMNPPQPESFNDAHEAIYQHLMSNGDLPDDWQDRLVAANTAQERSTVTTSMIHAWHSRVSLAIDFIIRRHRDDLLGSIRDSLTPVVARLRENYELVGPGMRLDAPALLAVAQATQEVRSALVAISEDTDTYVMLRRAQLGIHACNSVPLGDAHTGLKWGEIQQTGILELSKLSSPGYPAQDLDGESGVQDAVRGVVTRPDVWVPTTAEVAEAWDALARTQAVVDAVANEEAQQLSSSDAPNPVPMWSH